jgi:hypothetical protein
MTVEKQKVHHIPHNARRLLTPLLRPVDHKVPPEASRLTDVYEGRVQHRGAVDGEVREGCRARRRGLVILLPLVEVVSYCQRVYEVCLRGTL